MLANSDDLMVRRNACHAQLIKVIYFSEQHILGMSISAHG